MRYEYKPHPEEVAFFRTYMAELREDLQSGLLKELTAYPQFVVWRYRFVEGTLKKPPFSPRTHYPAQVDNPRTWGTIRQALGALATGYFHGIRGNTSLGSRQTSRERNVQCQPLHNHHPLCCRNTTTNRKAARGGRQPL
jgi:hypothetical protein